jgi:hypothetical protein
MKTPLRILASIAVAFALTSCATLNAPKQDAFAHFEAGQKYVAAGAYAEGLQEYLWCWDRGGHDAAFRVAKRKEFFAAFAALAKIYPPAASALQAKADESRRYAEQVRSRLATRSEQTVSPAADQFGFGGSPWLRYSKDPMGDVYGPEYGGP